MEFSSIVCYLEASRLGGIDSLSKRENAVKCIINALNKNPEGVALFVANGGLQSLKDILEVSMNHNLM